MASLSAAGKRNKAPTLAWLWPSADDTGAANPVLVKSGLLLVFAYLALVFLPDPVYSILRFVINPVALFWIALALPFMSGRLRFAFPFYVLLLLQVWMVISMLLTQDMVYKPFATGEYLWFPVEIGMIYLTVISLGALSPSAIRYAINWFLALCALSALMAMLQAAHIGPAIRVAHFYVYRSIASWDNVSGVRASGLANNPNSNVMSMIVAAGFVAWKSTRRMLRWMDYGLWGLFLVAAFVAQHRSSMPLIALTFLVTALIMFRRRPVALAGLFIGTLGLFLVTGTVLKHNFAYTFETTWSENTPQLRGRLEEERHAATYIKRFPLTGTGPNPVPENFTIYSTNEFDFKVENLYYAIGLVLGVPGVILVLTMYVGAFAIAVALALNRTLPRDTRVLMALGALGAVDLLWNGNVAVNITQYHLMFPFLLLLAVAQIAMAPRAAQRRLRVSPYLHPRGAAAGEIVRR